MESGCSELRLPWRRQPRGSEVADPGFVTKATRRRFSGSHKLKILEEVERGARQVGAILGSVCTALTSAPGSALKARLERELCKALAIIEAQEKRAEILGVDLAKITDSDPDTSE
jgi:hypothetical protein